MLAGMYYERTGDLETIRAIWPNIQAALRWIDECGDRDGDGFVEYAAKSERGLSNQGWKDSHDSIFHADGRLAEGPIALCEVQGYVFAAKRLAARLASALGFGALADALRAEAAALRERFEAAFWCADLGDVRAGARRRQAALPRALLQCRPRAALPASPARDARGPRRRRTDGPALLLGLGHPHGRRR